MTAQRHGHQQHAGGRDSEPLEQSRCGVTERLARLLREAGGSEGTAGSVVADVK